MEEINFEKVFEDLKTIRSNVVTESQYEEAQLEIERLKSLLQDAYGQVKTLADDLVAVRAKANAFENEKDITPKAIVGAKRTRLESENQERRKSKRLIPKNFNCETCIYDGAKNFDSQKRQSISLVALGCRSHLFVSLLTRIENAYG